MDRHDVLDPEQLDGKGGLAWPHRVVTADRQECDVRPMELADQPHVAEHVRVAGVVQTEAVLQLEHEPGRLAEVERRLAARIPVARRMVRPGHGDPETGRLARSRPCSCR